MWNRQTIKSDNPDKCSFSRKLKYKIQKLQS